MSTTATTATTTATTTTTPPLHLTTTTLRAHLQDVPFNDWLHLHGRRWLERQPTERMQEMFGQMHTTKHFQLQMERIAAADRVHRSGVCSAAADTMGHHNDGSVFCAFYEWTMDTAKKHQMPRFPTRVPHQMCAHSAKILQAQQADYTVIESPRLVLCVSEEPLVHLTVHPRLLISAPLARLLLQDTLEHTLHKTTHPNVTFAPWVAVEWTSSTATLPVTKRRLTHTARNNRYMATKMQAVYEAIRQTTAAAAADTLPSSLSSFVTGIVLNPRAPLETVQFYVSVPQQMTLTSTPSAAPVPTVLSPVAAPPTVPPPATAPVHPPPPAPPATCHATTVYPWQSAVQWAIRVRQEGADWDPVTDRSLLEMCPPPSDKDVTIEEYRPFVKWLRGQRADMCLAYRVGILQRSSAWSLGARTYHDLWSMQKTLQPVLKLTVATQKIVWANHCDNPAQTMVTPRKLSNALHRAFVQSLVGAAQPSSAPPPTPPPPTPPPPTQPSITDFFPTTTKKKKTVPSPAPCCPAAPSQPQKWFVVDMETLRSHWIFMIAVACYDPATDTHEVYVDQMDELTAEAQAGLLSRWLLWMHARRELVAPTPATPAWQPPPLLHWAPAERTFLKSLFRYKPEVLEVLRAKCPFTHAVLTAPARPSPVRKQANKTTAATTVPATTLPAGGLLWADLCQVFLNEPIAIPGCFDYQLKHVIPALVRMGAMPSTHVWASDGVQNGRAAQCQAEEVYAQGGLISEGSEVHQETMAGIRVYNEADVMVLVDVVRGVLGGMV